MQIINLLLSCLQFLVMNIVLLQTFRPRILTSHRHIFLITFSALTGLIEYLLFSSSLGFAMYFLFTLLFYEILTIFVLEGQIVLKFLLSLILIIYKILLVPLGDILAMRLVGGVQPLSGFPLLVSKLFVLLFLLPVSFFLVKCKIPNHEDEHQHWSFLTSFFSIVMMLNLLFLVQTIPDSVSNFSYNLCMILIVTLCYYLLYHLKMSFYRELNYRVELEQHYCEKLYAEQVKSAHENLCKLRHDFKNHILYMELMLKNKEYSQLAEYFGELSENTTRVDQVINTGNQLVNAVLNTKILSVADANIPIEVHASLPESMPISNTDLVSLVTNLFDNAAEASSKIVAPWIRIRMDSYKGYIRFQFENAVEKDLPINSSALKTTKPDTLNHGYGLKIIQEIVERNGGSRYIRTADGVFYVQILIPYSDAENK